MKRYVLLVLAALLLLLCACERAQEGPPPGESVTFTDALGRTVTVGKQPQRVAALLGSYADVWMLAGGSLCAAAEDAWEDFGLDPEGAVNLGGAHSPSLELLLSAEPDFVLASASTASNVELLDVLEGVGIPVAYFDVDHFDDYLQMLELCTELTGEKERYEEYGLRLLREIQTYKAACTQTMPQEERKILLLRVSAGSVKAKGSEGTVLGEMLKDLGCINIADSDGSLLENLSVESVIKQEPYRIFVVTMGDDTEKALYNLRQMMEENPAWGTLEAVQQGRMHLMDRKLFNIKPNVRWAESYEILSQILLE